MKPRTEPVFRNVSDIQKLIIIGICHYLCDVMVTGDRDGQYHGKTGLNRAHKLKKYLEKPLSVKDIMALLLAVFGKRQTGLMSWLPMPGRSSRLAGLIADQLIQGEWQHGVARRIETLSTSVFSISELKKAVDETDNTRTVPNRAIFSYFDKTLGVRYLIDEALKNDFKKEASEIRNAAKKLSANLNDSSQQIDFSLLTDPQGEHAFTVGSAVGALQHHRLPSEVTRIIGSFLTRKDAGRLVQTTKSALEEAKAERKFIKR